jgi:hypothetical protein
VHHTKQSLINNLLRVQLLSLCSKRSCHCPSQCLLSSQQVIFFTPIESEFILLFYLLSQLFLVQTSVAIRSAIPSTCGRVLLPWLLAHSHGACCWTWRPRRWREFTTPGPLAVVVLQRFSSPSGVGHSSAWIQFALSLHLLSGQVGLCG